MLTLQTHIRTFSWLFIASIFLATVQVTVAGYQADESSWFNLLTNVMAEEENEDAETEEVVKEVMWAESYQFEIQVEVLAYQNTYRAANPYISILGEVNSPPPEA
ncbi:MAG: hypothetical protein KBF73_09125 [Flavobacteriales bacterium]|nr:hypothetical protein [Flavobacteriales bacterium]